MPNIKQHGNVMLLLAHIKYGTNQNQKWFNGEATNVHPT